MNQVIEEKADPASPETLEANVRFLGTIIILVLLFLVAKFVVPDELVVPPYDSANLNEAQLAKQEEYFDQKKKKADRLNQEKARLKKSAMEGAIEVTIDGRTVYLLSNHTWIDDLPSWFEIDIAPALYPWEMQSIAGLAAVSEPIPAWINPEGSISYVQYNKKVLMIIYLIWAGLIYSFITYIAIFNRSYSLSKNWPGDKDSPWNELAGLFGIVISILFLACAPYFLVNMYHAMDQPSLALTAFWVPLLSMFTLWVLTRKPDQPKELEVVETNEGVAV